MVSAIPTEGLPSIPSPKEGSKTALILAALGLTGVGLTLEASGMIDVVPDGFFTNVINSIRGHFTGGDAKVFGKVAESSTASADRIAEVGRQYVQPPVQEGADTIGRIMDGLNSPNQSPVNFEKVIPPSGQPAVLGTGAGVSGDIINELDLSIQNGTVLSPQELARQTLEKLGKGS